MNAKKLNRQEKRIKEIRDFMEKHGLFTSSPIQMRARIAILSEKDRRFAFRARPVIDRLRMAENMAEKKKEGFF